MKRRAVWISAIPVLAVMLLIFVFSAQNAEASTRTSGRLTGFLVRLFCRGFDGRPAAEQRVIWGTASLLVRKLAHFTEFAALGFLLLLHLQAAEVGRRWLWPASWAFSTLYAASDELHQFLSEGRAPRLADCLIDSAGAALGAAAALLIVMAIKRRRT